MRRVVSPAEYRREYAELDRKASAITTKLRDHVYDYGAYENIGQAELRHFCELVDRSDVLDFQVKLPLKTMLSRAVDSL